ncbi:MAG: HD domain-containing protein [Bacteroidales bacterium]|nr:HD domain-containing protein [Bacteroidales bacterium]
MNKRKIINDPVHGFISIPDELHFDLIEHPYFQRLRRIKQLGLTHLVYPGAFHTRFHHALGAMHLMVLAIGVLRTKGIQITEEEEQAATIAILLHDIGHGPFSHALEYSIVKGMRHETLSDLFMNQLNQEFDGKLEMALQIFRNTYHKHFLYQMVAGQLDVDRLDYLRRDSYFTGVSEGMIGTERIIKMLNVRNDHLVVESKGIYSIRHFLASRDNMYWQVYLHRTVLSAENLLIKTLSRAKEIASGDSSLFATPALRIFLNDHFTLPDFISRPELLEQFAKIDDFDIISCVKVWADHSDDPILSMLSQSLIQRKLFRIQLNLQPFSQETIDNAAKEAGMRYNIDPQWHHYLIANGEVENTIYHSDDDPIIMLEPSGNTIPYHQFNPEIEDRGFSRPVKKFYLCTVR